MFLVAKKRFTFPLTGVNKRVLMPGDTFEAKEQFAKSLIGCELAEEAPKPEVKVRQYKRRDLMAEEV